MDWEKRALKNVIYQIKRIVKFINSGQWIGVRVYVEGDCTDVTGLLFAPQMEALEIIKNQILKTSYMSHIGNIFACTCWVVY